MPRTRRLEIGSRIRECRLRVRLSQTDMAEELGLSDSAISSWESGDRMPSAETLADMCLVLGVSADYILYGTDMVPRDLAEMFQRVGQRRPSAGA